MDNIIYRAFAKIFNQLTSNGTDLTTIPFVKIKHITFDCPAVCHLINKLTYRPESTIKSILSSKQFQKSFLLTKLENALDVAVCMSDIAEIKMHTTISKHTLNLVVINGDIEVAKLFHTFTSANLIYAAEFGHEQMYFYLSSLELKPNITIYNKAVQSDNLAIVKNISQHIGISKETIELAFESNHTEIVLHVVSEALEEKIPIPLELVAYAVLNENFELIDKLDKLIPIDWSDDFYYSAVLSGSMPMIKFLETKLPLIHKNHVLDMAKTHKGQKSLLMAETVYVKNGSKYFSHVINYASQSKSVKVLKYVHGLGYGVTLSNIINAIQHGTSEIFSYLVDVYDGSLPAHLWTYFSFGSYVPDKLVKMKILVEAGFDIGFNLDRMELTDYKLETAHLELIDRSVNIKVDDLFDPDYLMQYSELFVLTKENVSVFRRAVRIRMCIELDLEFEIELESDQLITDVIFLFGQIKHIKRMSHVPSQKVLIEVLAYGQIGKLSLIMPMLSGECKEKLIQCGKIIADPLIDSFLLKY